MLDFPTSSHSSFLGPLFRLPKISLTNFSLFLLTDTKNRFSIPQNPPFDPLSPLHSHRPYPEPLYHPLPFSRHFCRRQLHSNQFIHPCSFDPFPVSFEQLPLDPSKSFPAEILVISHCEPFLYKHGSLEWLQADDVVICVMYLILFADIGNPI